MVVSRYPSPLDASSSIPPPPQAFLPGSIRHPSPTTMYDNSFSSPTSRSGRRGSSKSFNSAELKAAAAAAALASTANITPNTLSSPISPRSLSSPSSCPSSRSNVSLTPSMSPSSIISLQRSARQEKKHHQISVQNIALSLEEQKQIKSSASSSRGKKSGPVQTLCSATLYTNVPSEQLLLQQQHLLQQEQEQQQQQLQQQRSDKAKKSKPRKETLLTGLSAKSRIAAWAAAIRPSFPSRSSSASSIVSSSSSSICSGAAAAAAPVAPVAPAVTTPAARSTTSLRYPEPQSMTVSSSAREVSVHASERRSEDKGPSHSPSPPASFPTSSSSFRHHSTIDTPPVNEPLSSSSHKVKTKKVSVSSHPPLGVTSRSAHASVPQPPSSQPQPRSLHVNGIAPYSSSFPTSSPPRAGRGRPLSRSKGKKVGSGVITAFCIAAIVILVLC